MAHRGHTWPLQFRRDYNFNVASYQFQLAEQYAIRFTTASFFGGPAINLNGAAWLVGPPTVLPDGSLRYNLAAGHVPVRGIVASIEISNRGPDWIPRREIVLTTFGGPIRYRWLAAQDAGRRSPIFIPTGGSEVFRDPAYVSGPATLAESTVEPIHYAGH